ncbi:IQ domain-containing protein IQM2-like [Tripterygium wilfordii]|uniref:IQ domain-containing protein IQM2-like n=1 Tax=Tripterygium wilfordii TaxID=458696 RepID=UPI0018F847BC|nr:IQ domain-containing protein IQM2-like [Tripterygium wilfordii]
MGVSFSCPFAEYGDVENELESVVVKSISFGDDKVKTPVRSVSFKRQDSIPTILTSLGSGKMIIEGSVSFKGRGDAMISINPSSLDKENIAPMAPIKTMTNDVNNQSPRSDSPSGTCQPLSLDPSNPKHEAATRLQKVYKSFRTRRKLADCAVLVEQSWWELLDFAELKRSSVSFFDIEKHESAISRWSRARTRAAKVGKGLSKNDKAQKMALQHWLEAIDPRHRYGHNLHFYYDKWLHCQSREPFFYWLDIGEGKEVNLDKCPRSKLQQQCIKYLGPMERKAYEVIIKDGKFLYKQTGEFLHTPSDAKWIFVLSASKILYAGKKKRGTFQHSSFLAGGATIAAGRLVAENGILKAVWPHSGHYRPTEENFRDFVSFLKENNVDLTDVEMTSIDEEEDSTSRQRSSNHLRSNSAEYLPEIVNVTETEAVSVEDLTQENIESMEQEYAAALKPSKSRRCRNLSRKLTDLKIPKEDGFPERLQNENSAAGPSCANGVVDSPMGNGYETAEEAFTSDQESTPLEQNSFDEGYKAEVETLPEESILRRINSKKGTKSYQLGKQLSCKWTTGAGPRIGCVRDYPSELQLRALEQVNLSPRSAGHFRTYSSPRNSSRPSPKTSSILSHCSGAVAETADSSVPEIGSLKQKRSQSFPLQRNNEFLVDISFCVNRKR